MISSFRLPLRRAWTGLNAESGVPAVTGLAGLLISITNDALGTEMTCREQAIRRLCRGVGQGLMGEIQTQFTQGTNMLAELTAGLTTRNSP